MTSGENKAEKHASSGQLRVSRQKVGTGFWQKSDAQQKDRARVLRQI
ncbi:hypothetical protein OOT33_04530 [Sphingobium sp. DEHP117]|nr:hypothetical protein [Sphingobium sp. DEHP117]MDQ4419706.1 hypothetical protein [Sphingobium sp. DEHP117]